jgi:hypothetical protein
MVTRKTPAARIACTAAFLVLALALVPAALAGKPGAGTGGNKHGGTTSYTGSFSVKLLNSTDGLPHWGQQITFTVSTTAPYNDVTVMCYQGGAWVYGNTVGFGAGWPWPQIYTLQSAAWTGGAADCNAEFYATTSSGTKTQTLSTMSFHVYA